MTYSNCLIESFRAKLRDPSHVRIIRFPRVLIDRLHFGWICGDYLYHAYNPRHKENSLFASFPDFLFRPRVKKIPRIIFESYVCDSLKGEPAEKQKKLMKKLGVHLSDIPYTAPDDGWHSVFSDADLPCERDVRYMEKLFRGTVFIKVITGDAFKGNTVLKVLRYEDVCNIKRQNGWLWRYITPLDVSDFCALYGNHIRVPHTELQD